MCRAGLIPALTRHPSTRRREEANAYRKQLPAAPLTTAHNVGRGAQTGMGFNTPVAMTIAPNGVVFVANRGSESISNVGWNRTGVGQRISKVALGSTWGEEEYIGEFSRYGNNDGQVIWPAGIASGNDGNLYVADEWLNRISVFDADGTFQRHFSAVPAEADPGENGSCGIAISADQVPCS